MTNDSTDNLASEVFHESHRITPNSSEEKRPNEIKIASIETGTEGSEQTLGVLTILMAAISILAGIGIAIFSAWTSPAFNNWWTEIKPSYGLIDQREWFTPIFSYLLLAYAAFRLFRWANRESYLTRIVSYFLPHEADRQSTPERVKFSTQIYDSSSLRRINTRNYGDLLWEILTWIEKMPVISNPTNPGEKIACERFNILSEQLASSTRHTFSLSTEQEENSGLNYTLDFEVDEDALTGDLSVTDVRFVIKYPQNQMTNYGEKTRQIVERLINQRLLGDTLGVRTKAVS